MLIMAGGIARGRARTTGTATESHEVVAILQQIGWETTLVFYRVFFFVLEHPCYGQLKPVSTRYMRWPVSHDHIAGQDGLKLRAYWGHVLFDVDRWPSAGFAWIIDCKADTTWKTFRDTNITRTDKAGSQQWTAVSPFLGPVGTV